MRDDRPVVLVTGASGFVGRHLSPLLARDGWQVRRAVRSLPSSHDDVVIGSMGPNTDWSTALAGVEAVVHLAARVHHPNEEHSNELYHEVNTEGTLHLARSASRAGVRQFVFVSTVLVHGRSNDGRAPFSEADLLTPQGTYGFSKAAAEAGLKILAQQADMNIAVIRPPLVYGSGAKGNFALLVRAVKLGTPLPFAAIANRRAFLSVENLASFVSWLLSNPDGRFEIFLVADAEQVSTPDFIRRIARAMGSRSRLFPLPTFLLSKLLTISGRQDTRDSLIGSLELDLSKAASRGWKPQVTLDEGLQRTFSARESG